MITPNRNARIQNETLLAHLGKKVIVGTTDFHYVCGQFDALEPDERLRLRVNGQAVRLHRLAVANIQEASAHLAEYVK